MATPAARKPKQATAPGNAGTAEPLSDRIQSWLLAGFVAVCVARPLVPSEGVAWLGDGHAFTMLLLLLTCGYLLLVWSEGRFTRRFHATDAGVLALVAFCLLSALLGVYVFFQGNSSNAEFRARFPAPRLALNMTWEWIGLGLTYFLARQLPKSGGQTRVLVAIMIALATAMSVLGLYQVAVTLPAERAAYEADPDGVLTELGQWYEPGSPERVRFESRLASTEPLGTFALTNSLAGLLVTWITVCAGVLWQTLRAQRGTPLDGKAVVRMSCAVAAIGVMLVCLALTKSRSAYVALAAGALLLPLVMVSFSKATWKRLGAGIAVVVAVVAGLAATGAGRPLVNDAARSFQFRLEYWQATLDLIATFPMLGVGPGEFQDYYTTFKLPQASEEVRDPHNFILEVWATGGTFALVGLLAVLGGFGMAWYETRARESEDEERASPPSQPWLPLAGALAALPLAYAAGLPFGFFFTLDQVVIIVFSGAITLYAIWQWLRNGSLPRGLPALGALVLMIHLLASGGFTFPGVSGSFWILVALTVNQAVKDSPESAGVRRGFQASWPRWSATGGIAVTLVALVACYLTGLLPVLASRATMARAANTELSPETRFGIILQAAAADWANDEPYMAMAELSAEQVRKDPTNSEWAQNLVKAARSVVALHGHSSANMRRLSTMFREVYALTGNTGAADRCVDMARLAVQFYPNSPVLQAEYALSLDTVSNTLAARRVAEKALKLDELTPHADKKLPEDLRQRMRELAENDEDS